MGPIGRIESLQAMIRVHGLSGAVLFYSRDVFYYTGTAQPSYLVVLPEDYFLFVRSGYEFALGEAFIDGAKIREERRLESIYREIFSHSEDEKIATELDIMPAAQYLAFKEVFACCDLVDASPLVLEQRKRKDPLEIKSIQKACQAIDAGHRAVLSNLKEGITELELAIAESLMQLYNNLKPAFGLRLWLLRCSLLIRK
jgi:Xaa-Pro dipeptidase